VLGYSCAHDNFTFNFMSSPAVRKIISDFKANNVKVGIRLLVSAFRSADDRHLERTHVVHWG
jgi:hypothetical protein